VEMFYWNVCQSCYHYLFTNGNNNSGPAMYPIASCRMFLCDFPNPCIYGHTNMVAIDLIYADSRCIQS
jgi:hypothetical protein